MALHQQTLGKGQAVKSHVTTPGNLVVPQQPWQKETTENYKKVQGTHTHHFMDLRVLAKHRTSVLQLPRTYMLISFPQPHVYSWDLNVKSDTSQTSEQCCNASVMDNSQEFPLEME